MKKVILALSCFIFLSLLSPSSIFAAALCSTNDITISVSPLSAYTGSGAVNVSITVDIGMSTSIDLTKNYRVSFKSLWDVDQPSETKILTTGPNSFTITIPENTNATYIIKLEDASGLITVFCTDNQQYISTKQVPVIHCTNNTQDADETGIDCGGTECNPCTGTSLPPPGIGHSAPPPCNPEAGFGSSATGVITGIGCIPTEPINLVRWILKYAILMGGGIAFLLSVFGGVSIILAGGNPEKINAGKEIISSALTGLLFIVFSVFLLRLIGLDILQLPGFKNP